MRMIDTTYKDDCYFGSHLDGKLLGSWDIQEIVRQMY